MYTESCGDRRYAIQFPVKCHKTSEFLRAIELLKAFSLIKSDAGEIETLGSWPIFCAGDLNQFSGVSKAPQSIKDENKSFRC